MRVRTGQEAYSKQIFPRKWVNQTGRDSYRPLRLPVVPVNWNDRGPDASCTASKSSRLSIDEYLYLVQKVAESRFTFNELETVRGWKFRQQQNTWLVPHPLIDLPDMETD